MTAGEINSNRQHAVRELQHKFGGVAILKGTGTLVCYIHEAGNRWKPAPMAIRAWLAAVWVMS